MKLWVKTTLALGTVGAASGAVVGSIAIFQKVSDKAKGVSYSTNNPLGNGYNIPSIRSLQLKDLETYFTKDTTNKAEVFAKYNAENDKVQQDDKELDFSDFNASYIKEYNDSPVQVVRFGPALFLNEYIDAVSPKEFAEYVVWFLKNVSWGGDLAALENFSLRRGVKTEGSTIILGEHSNTNNEKTTIEFYPDAFFGSLPAYSKEAGYGQGNDKLLAKLTDANNTLLTQEDIQEILNKKDEIIKWTADASKKIAPIKDFKIRSIIPAEQISEPSNPDRNGKMGYEVYVDLYPDLIDNTLTRYPYLAKELSGLHLEDGKLVNGKYKGIDPGSRIPFLAVLSATDPNFKGVGINWLKYVGQHEYGHHITLQSLQDGSEKGAYVGGVSILKTLTPGQYYSLDAINKYLAARAKGLSAQAAGIDENTTGEFIRFVENGIPEANKDVYGSTFASNLQEAIDNERRRAGRATLDDLAKVAQARGVSLQDLIIENAWDINSGTINPGSSGEALVYSIDKSTGEAKLVPFTENLKDILKDAAGNPIEIASRLPVIQYWIADDGVTKVEPVSISFSTNDFIAPKDPNHLIKNFDPLTTPRKTVIMEKTANGLQPIIADNCNSQELLSKVLSINVLISSLTTSYTINGWTTNGSMEDYLKNRSETKLQTIFSDYSYNIAEMTNRDYIQVTYTPGQETLSNTPSWLADVSEATTGFEFFVDAKETSVYYKNMLAGSSMYDAVAKAFNFKFTAEEQAKYKADPSYAMSVVEAYDVNEIYNQPSKGIIAAANAWYNYANRVMPGFVGQSNSMVNGYFKDDYLRRSVGNEVYAVNDSNSKEGDWKYTIIGSDVYNSVVSQNDHIKPIGKSYGSALNLGALTDASGNIQANWKVNRVANTSTTPATYDYDVIDDKQNKIGTLDLTNNANEPLKAIAIKDGSTLKGYCITDALSIDNKQVQYKVIDQKLYAFDLNSDYKNIKQDDVLFQIQGNEIYNTDGSSVIDNTIAIKDIYKNPVNDRAKAVWEWLLQSKGIGDGLEADPVTKVATKTGRNIEGIWRSPERDATYAWGYIPSKMNIDGKDIQASDIKYLEYKDVSTGATKYVPVWIGQNNLYYYKDRTKLNDPSNNISSPSISYIEDEGITSWTSDFISMGGYWDADLTTGHSYVMSLVDENHDQLIKIDLGSRTTIAENGKPIGKAPNIINKVGDDAVITIRDQFNN